MLMFFIVFIVLIDYLEKYLRSSLLNEELWFFSQNYTARSFNTLLKMINLVFFFYLFFFFLFFVCNQMLINWFLKHYQFI